MSSDPLLVSFIGASGAGKTTCRALAEAVFQRFGYFVFRMDVAEPLREIQAAAYRTFGRPDPGRTFEDDFKHDGVLQGFLAEHFQRDLGPTFVRRFEDLRQACFNHPTSDLGCVLNADCRNNSYESLRNLGFLFVRVEAMPEVLQERRERRGDLSPFNKASVEPTNAIREDFTIHNNEEDLTVLRSKIFSLVGKLSAKHELKIRLSDS